MRLVILILSLVGTLVGHTATAAISCDELLAAASSEVTSATKGLSQAARTYVNLIRLYINQSDSKTYEVVINKILNSPDFINPFAESKDSLSVQLAIAMSKIEPQLNKKDWSLIKKSIRELVRTTKQEDTDRKKKEIDTERVLHPQIIDTKTLRENERPWPSMHIINDRMYFVREDKKGSWHLFTLIDDTIYQLVDGQLKSWNEKKFDINRLSSPPQWQELNGRLFLVAPTYKNSFKIFEFKDDRLIEKDEQKVEDFVYSVNSQVVDGRLYIAWAAKDFHLYEFVNDKLVERAALVVENSSWRAPVWQIVDGRVFLALGTKDKLELYELLGDELKLIDSGSIDFESRSEASWHVNNNKVFIVIGTLDWKYRLFEVIGGKLKFIDAEASKRDGFRVLSWYNFNGRLFFATITLDEFSSSHLVFYEVTDSSIRVAANLKLPNEYMRLAPGWELKENGDIHIKVFSSDRSNTGNHRLRTIDVFKKVKK